MAQTLSGVSINSKIIATAATQGTNIQNDIRVGRSLSQSIATTYADIVYSVKFTANANGDVVVWDLDLHKFTANASDSPTALDRTGHTFTGFAANNGTPGTPTDLFGDTLPTASSVVAMMYETDSSNAGNITCVADDVKFGNITLAGGSGTGATGAHTRSALLVPRADPSGVNITITFANSGDDLTVLVLAKE
tara:strand:- start:2312 stop:2890 length:579 start_codon:yes stop_codon:yes gene_type:complete